MLSRPKCHFTKEIVDDVLENIENRGVRVEAEMVDIVLPDPEDRVFYEVVLEKRKTEEAYLVTGNIKHFQIETVIILREKCLVLCFLEQELNSKVKNGDSIFTYRLLGMDTLQRRKQAYCLLFCMYIKNTVS